MTRTAKPEDRLLGSPCDKHTQLLLPKLLLCGHKSSCYGIQIPVTTSDKANQNGSGHPGTGAVLCLICDSPFAQYTSREVESARGIRRCSARATESVIPRLPSLSQGRVGAVIGKKQR